MKIKKIKLKNHRNYKNLELEFSEGINILIGENAQGKTNILEAVYCCALGRSYRTNKISEIIMWEENFSMIELDLESRCLEKQIRIMYKDDNKKIISINSKNIQKISDLIGNVKVVMFSPEDLKIVKGAYSNRRVFLNMELCQINSKYYNTLSKYNSVLKERNALLKKRDVDECMLDVYDDFLAEYGSYIINQRLEYVNMLNEEGEKIHNTLSSNKEKIFFEYVSKINPLAIMKDNIKEILINNRKRDIITKVTNVGIHRDYFSVLLNNKEVKDFGSQGQQRTAVLTIKFASSNIIKKVTNEKPIFLLDDVMSELDLNRQKFVFEEIKEHQALITTTGYNNIDEIIDSDIMKKIFTIVNGKIKES